MSCLVEPGQPATDVEDPPEPPAETLEEEEKRFKKKTDQEKEYIIDRRKFKVSGFSGQRKDDDDAVCVWDLSSFGLGRMNSSSPRLVSRGQTGEVSALVKLDNARLASAGDDKVIRIWNVAGDAEAVTPVATLKGHTSEVTCLATKGGWLASGSLDSSVRVWDLTNDTGGVADRAASRRGVDEGEQANAEHEKFDSEAQARATELKGHTNWVNCLAALNDGRFASGGYDKSVIIWNPGRAEPLVKELKGHMAVVRCLATLADDRLASGSMDKSILIWNLADGTQLAKLEGHTGDVNCLAVLDGNRLASGGDDKSVIIWNVADSADGVADGAANRIQLKGHTKKVLCLANFDDGRLASGGADANIIIWNVAAGSSYELLAVLPGHAGPIRCLAVLDDNQIASGGAYKKKKDFVPGAINDSCKTGVDRFGSRPLAEAIVEVVGGATPPLCVGLYAKWGRGKSFLINQLKQAFDPTARVDQRGGGQIVQHFEPGYDKLERAVTDEDAKVDDTASRSTCGKVLDFISNALFYLLTLTLWWFYKRETVITIIDTVAETFNDIGAIGKYLRDRTFLACCRSARSRGAYRRVYQDGHVAWGSSEAQRLAEWGSLTGRFEQEFSVVVWCCVFAGISWVAALSLFLVRYPASSAPYSYVLIGFFVASLPILWYGFIVVKYLAHLFYFSSSQAGGGGSLGRPELSWRMKMCRMFCLPCRLLCRYCFRGTKPAVKDESTWLLECARAGLCAGALWAFLCLYVSLVPSLRSKVTGFAVTIALLAALCFLGSWMAYAIHDLFRDIERETRSKPAAKREFIFVDYNARVSAQVKFSGACLES